MPGTITEINEALADNPELINEEPYESWLVTLELSNPSEVAELIDSAEYEKLCQQGE